MKLIELRVKAFRSELQEQISRGGSNVSQGFGAERDGCAAADSALIGGRGGVAHHELNPLRSNVQLLGYDLSEARFNAHSDFHFAGEDANGSIFFDSQPRI